MPNSPDNKEVSLAQVGFTFNNDKTSIIGVRRRDLGLITTPRIVIMEPPTLSNKYRTLHEGYKQIVVDTSEKLGARSNLLKLIRGDIYKPDSLEGLPPIAFLVLEDVLSDPFYKGNKDFESLIRMMSQTIIKGGIVLTLDSKLPGFSDQVKTLVQHFLAVALVSENFTTLLELLDFEGGKDSIEPRNSEQVKQVIATELSKLNVYDPALEAGLNTLRLGIYHCLVLQRV